jgi:dephospho-CoA kinase
MKKIALTGGIACGKSLTGVFIQDEGIPVCDADDVARDVMSPGHPVTAAILREFGSAIEGPGGEIDRVRLAEIVFSDPARLAVLNGLVHPAVREAIVGWLAGLPAAVPVAVVIIPLLFEARMEAGWDGIITVSSPQALQWRRLLERGLTEEDANRRLAAQWPQAGKMERADWVIFNCGSRELLRDQVKAVLRPMVER